MTSTLETRPDVVAYLASVREHLADLPSPDRDDLLAEVAASVHDAAVEGSIEERLGSPDRFAEELRLAAGLAPTPARRRRLDLRRLGSSAGAHLRALRDLEPIWWAIRGYVAVTALGFATGWSYLHPAIPRFVNSPSDARDGALVSILAVIVSVALGLWLRRRASPLRRLSLLFDGLALALVIPVALHVARTHPVYQTYVYSAPPAAGLLYDGRSIENIYPYTRDGRLLHDVLLYDQTGRPLAVNPGDTDPNRRVLHTAAKYVPIFNSFPIRYFESGTHRVAHPNAGPRVSVAKLAPGP
jgi:hypothetical protein